jgi:hypothetical protein
MEICEVLPKIWNYMKFCQKYEICEVLPKIWNYMKFCPGLGFRV